MTRRPIAALGLLVMLALPGPLETTAAAGPAPVSVDPDTPVSNDEEAPRRQPVWPGLACDRRSAMSVDHSRMSSGYATPEDAVEHSPVPDLPDGVLTPAPDSGKGPVLVWVVDPETEEIQAEVSVYRGPQGWFVDGVVTCG